MYKRMLVMSIAASLVCELRGVNEKKEEKEQNRLEFFRVRPPFQEPNRNPVLLQMNPYRNLYEKGDEFSIYNVMGEIPNNIGENSKLQKVNFFETDTVERYGGKLKNGLYIDASRYKRDAEKIEGVLYILDEKDLRLILSANSAQSYFNCFKKLYEEH